MGGLYRSLGGWVGGWVGGPIYSCTHQPTYLSFLLHSRDKGFCETLERGGWESLLAPLLLFSILPLARPLLLLSFPLLLLLFFS